MILITLLYLALLAVVPPFFNYPVIDDWVYARSVQILLDQGRMRLLECSTPNLVFQAAYGALVCRAFGFSFAALRCSTLLLAYLASLTGFRLLRRLDFSRPAALAAVLTLALNPLYLLLGYSFMTDVPFIFFMLLCLLLYARGIDTQSAGWLLLGSLAAAAASLVRQYGILLPAALFVCLCSSRRISFKTGLAVLAPPLGAYLAFMLWLTYIHGTPAAYTVRSTPFYLPYVLVHLYARRFWFLQSLFVMAEYMGLFMMPLLLGGLLSRACWRDLWARGANRALLLAWTVFVGAGVGYYLAAGMRIMPYGGTMLINTGLGPLSLRDAAVLMRPPPLRLPFSAWLAVTIISSVGAVVLGTLASRRLVRAAFDAWRSLSARQLKAAAFVLTAAAVLLASCVLILLISDDIPLRLGRRMIAAAYERAALANPGIGPLERYLDALPAFLGRNTPLLLGASAVGLLFSLIALRKIMKKIRLRTSGAFPSSPRPPASGPVLASGLLMLLVTIYISYFFDRYLIIFIFPAAVLVLSWWKNIGFRPRFSMLAAGIVLLGVFSLASVHDYLAWNGARWDALNWLTGERGIPPEEIDGGMEFNGLYTYDESDRHARPGKSWWWVIDDRYIVAFSPLPGYDIMRKVKYKCWMDFRNRNICVLSRKE